MKHLTSAANPLIKQLKRLASNEKDRRRLGQTILEGIHLAQSYLQAKQTPLLCLTTDSWVANPEVQSIVQQVQDMGVEVITMPQVLFQSLSAVEHGIGLALVIAIPPSPQLQPLQQNSLLLDSIQDPGNVGTMLRTAAAAGISQIYASLGCASLYSPKVLRAGMGAHFSLQLHEQTNLAQLIQASTIPVYATSLQAQQSLYQLNLIAPAAWLFGSEGQGVSPDLLQLSVQPVFIPQAPQVESLNVAAATAVCLFEQRRQQLLSSSTIKRPPGKIQAANE